MASDIEQNRAILLQSAEKVGVANVFAQHHGDQLTEIAGDFNHIAEGARMVLEGIAAVMAHSKTAFESASIAENGLKEAISAIKAFGFSQAKGDQRIMDRLDQYHSDLVRSGVNMTEIESLADYLPVLQGLRQKAVGGTGVLRENSRTILEESGKFGPLAKQHFEQRANEL